MHSGDLVDTGGNVAWFNIKEQFPDVANDNFSIRYQCTWDLDSCSLWHILNLCSVNLYFLFNPGGT